MTFFADFLRSLIIVSLIQFGIIFLIKILLENRRQIFSSVFSFSSSKRYLPHPPTLPFLGNLLQLRKRPLEKLNQWSKKYGPIYGLYLGRKYFIVLNNHEVVSDLIVKRGSDYSSRYDFNDANSILIKSNSLSMCPYGDKWKRDRSVAYSALVSRPIKSYNSYIYKDTDLLIHDILTKHGQSINPLQFIKKYVLTNMLNVLFGSQTFRGRSDPFLGDVMKLMDDIIEFSSPASVLGELTPFSNFMHKPNIKKAEKVYSRMEKIFSSKYNEFLRDYAKGENQSPSFLLQIQEAINEKENNSIEYEDIWQMLISLLNGAMESEVNTLMWAIACLANNPGVQDEAFKELDDCCEKMPTMNDEMGLPYINAIINETLRFRPPNAFGFVRVAGKDDEYDGYFIPKGTPILLNLYAINHNERRFISPETFRPSRFMDEYSTGSVKSRSILLPQFDYDSGIEFNSENEKVKRRRKRSSLNGLLKNNSPSLTNSSMPMHMSFGAGRRYCIGQHLAQKQMYLALACILWAFEIKPGVSDDRLTPISPNLDGGKITLTSYSPSPYKVRFLLRKDIGLLL